MTHLLAGATAGLLATVPQSVAMQAVRLLLPAGLRGGFPPRQVAEDVLERLSPRRRPPRLDEMGWWAVTALSHFGYGAAMGAGYALLPGLPRPGSARGIGFGITVWAGSYLLVLPAVGIRAPQGDRPVSKNLQLIAAHLAWARRSGRSTPV